jgi:DNA-binding SARP family transcriptional activator/TolB-like protein
LSEFNRRATFGAQHRTGLSSRRQPERHLALSAGTTLRLRTLGGLWIEGDADPQPAVRPRRLALLAILAVAGARGATREQVLAILWPESEPDKARHALSQTLYSLRHDLGGEFVTATAAALRIDAERMTSDLDALRAALAERDGRRAAELYPGPFLDGFYLAGAPEFERWVEEERRVLARSVVRAIHDSARAASDAGRHAEAAGLAERLVALDPLDGAHAALLVRALIAAGRRDEALAHGEAYVARVAQEWNAPPDEAVLDALAEARAGAARRRTPAAPPDSPVPDAGDVRESASPGRLGPPRDAAVTARRRWTVVAAALVLLAVAAAAASRIASRGDARSRPVVAVGVVRDLVTPDSAQVGSVLSEMLATSLGRLTNLSVVANSRILELVPRGADTVPAARAEAARRAGATEVLEGELMMTADRQLHLALRRVDLDGGIVRRSYQAAGPDRLALFDSITALVAADLDLAAPARSLGDVATRSPLAYRMYEEGLRAFFQFDVYAANRLLHAAVREDSGFVMAVYYAWRSEDAIGGPQADALADRAVALASRAADRDRLLVLAHVGMRRGDLRAIAAADSLARRFDRDPEALIRAAEATVDLSRAAVLLDRAIAIDSAAAAAPLAVCRSCEALAVLARRYAASDSADAVERTYRRWIRLRPGDSAPWEALGEYLVGLGRRGEANAALARADSLGATGLDAPARRLTRSLRADDLEAAMDICRAALATSNAAEWLRFRRPCAIGLREQGRFREALALVRGRPGGMARAGALPRDTLLEAVLDLEMGRPLAAAEEFRQAAAAEAGDRARPPGLAAGAVAWYLTLAATARVAAGDTLGARALIDTVQAAGMRSLDPRDAGLHRFLRGALLARAGEHEGAVRELRAAISSPSQGFTRINVELAASLMALGRPREAVPVLRAPLRGNMGDSELLATHTELHRMLARAFAAAGQRDSALAHAAVAERNWRGADGPPQAALSPDPDAAGPSSAGEPPALP